MKNTFSLQSNNQILARRYDTGVILHLYYPEMWEEIFSYLNNLGEAFDLFVTIPYEVDFSDNQITSKYPDAYIYRCENRGRDVAPFLAIFSLVSGLGYKYLCKIHTKRNMQLVPEVNWRQDVLSKLLGSPEIIQDIKAAFDNHTDWGMVAPQGHVVPSNYFWQQNSARVTELANSIGIQIDNIEFSYVAGTMFWFRPEAFNLILKADIDYQDFAPEQGQKDATLAHAIERFFGLAIIYAGYKIAESNSHDVQLANVSLHFRALSRFYEDLQQEYHANGDFILALQEVIDHLQQENQTLRQENQTLRQENQTLRQENQTLEQQISTLEKLTANLENNIRSLKEENLKLKLEITSLYASSSWRITQPMRDAKTLAQKVLQRVRGNSRLQLDRTPVYPTDLGSKNTAQLHGIVENSAIENVKTPYPQIRIVDRRKISVIITSYNHERYIKQCLDSILEQKGSFNMEIILGDDSSTDNTREILKQYCQKYPDIFKLMPEQENMGVTKNLKRCLDSCQGDFIAICEGDDYWTDEYKLEKQMKFLENHKEYSMCFSAFMFYYEQENKFSPFNDQITLQKDVLTTEDLIRSNYIGNFSCCMYRTDVVRKLPLEIFDVFTVDWMFNMACGEVGKIGFIRDSMSVYRKHADGLWTGKSVALQLEQLLKLIDIYDGLLSKKYHAQFEKLKQSINEVYFQNDLLILDTTFPHQLSPFRFQEFTSYFNYFLNSKVLTTGEHFFAFNESRSIQEVIEEFEKEYPQYKGRTIATSHDIEPYHGKLAYVVFLNNMRLFLATLEKKRISFVFTLYPGGGFELNKPESDEFLERIFNSPYFRKVIVTQRITFDYLITKKLCHPDQIEFIFGVVTPLELLKPYEGKKHFGFDKDTLDICFVAHKYMPKGVDKGYDVFIGVARKLTRIHNNIHFHVVGNFTEVDIPINGLEGKITFYGLKKREWFDSFYKDKDIILSPNVPFALAGVDGAFDGFPTASCTEAGLRNVAIFCTDILQLNIKFTDGKDIVIIPHDIDKIVDMINHLYFNPDKLKEIAESGSAKIREIYNYDNQIFPRIKILEELLKEETKNPKRLS